MTNSGTTSTTQPHHLQSTVLQWLRISLIAAVNVIVLGLFAAYFVGQTLNLLDILGILSDSIGIVTGLLGIWFFFLSEQLNRATAINLERTTSTVEDLRTQMWDMIQKTFNRFIEGENKELAIETQQALQTLREQLAKQEATSPQLIQALDTLTRRIDTLERQKEQIASIPTIPPPTIRNSVQMTSPQLEVMLRKYVSGVRVKHSKFGEGVVVSARSVDGDIEVTVDFSDRQRRILARLANLQILSPTVESSLATGDDDIPF